MATVASAAQIPPDAGQLRQEIERSLPSSMPQPKLAPQAELPPPMTAMTGKVFVQQFRFAGNEALSDATLQTIVAGWTQRELSFAQLQEAAAAVGAAYRSAGRVVRAYLPRQEIKDGIVIIQIVEARFGAVRIEAAPGARMRPEYLQGLVESSQAPGQPLQAAALDRALLLLEELPGVRASGSLQEGKNQGETEVVVAVAPAPLLGGDASTDNTGSRSTGPVRLAVNFQLSSPLSFSDLATVSAAHTQGSNYGRLAYSVPLGSAGWRAGANVSRMRYRLVSAEFAALQASGDSGSAGVELQYPLLRARQANASLALAWERKDFNNVSGGAVTTRYKVGVLSAGLSGSASDAAGSNSGSVTMSSGGLDLDGSPNQSADAATTRSAGRYAKLRFSATRNQTLGAHWHGVLQLSGQYASKNLDSSEKFYLGGASGVRAYPSSEVGGADGVMVNAELRYRVQDALTLSAHADAGVVRVNHDHGFAGAPKHNRQGLRGAGLGVAWTPLPGASIKAVLSHRIGRNPNPAPSGADQDGTLVRSRLWLTASMAL
ncbi:ShlB/FhaC/HecB family hemolysin secretion/activation protein [Pseudoduganella ginsengisoli]|uniref:ShlB/FhaC/HecB family hemolysin secretion/activation protein n=1 Tax=Pseudoduganella ginsengisoli TaxID=1462440 RepID=UPI0014797697